jgi:hypothetical protein
MLLNLQSKFLLIAAFFAMTLLPLAKAWAAEPDPQVAILQPGVQLELVAEHPTLMTPTGVDVDHRGRVWLIASHTHFRPEGYVGPKHDEVVVLSGKHKLGDTTSRTVFYNKTDATMDLELGQDGWVYLAERDRIIRVRDSDGDNVGDVEELLAELTTEADYPHNGLSGLTWHPDGDLLFGLGENFSKPWTLKTPHGESFSGKGEGGIFGCRPDGTQFRRVARGMWNPFAVCVRDDGQIFAADNDPGERPPCRLLHVVPGGDYGYQRLYGAEPHHPFVAWNGELAGTLPMVHPTGEGPCAILPAGGGLIVPSWSDHRIDYFALSPKGGSFAAKRIALVKGGRYFRPVCMARDRSANARAEGTISWYLTDWVDGRYQIHQRGRLWRLTITPAEADWWAAESSSAASSENTEIAGVLAGTRRLPAPKLFEMARSADPYRTHAAVTALSRVADSWQPASVRSRSPRDRVTSLLALKSASDLHDLGRRPIVDPHDWLPMFLEDASSAVRFEALRWICDASFERYLPRIDEILSAPSTDFTIFEAAIACKNSLNNKPELGLRDETALLARIRSEETPATIRAHALRLLPILPRRAGKDDTPGARKLPNGVKLDELRAWLAQGDMRLALEVVRMAASDPKVGGKLLLEIGADLSADADLRAEAIAGLSPIASQHVDSFRMWCQSKEEVIRVAALQAIRDVPADDEARGKLLLVALNFPDSEDLVNAIVHPDALARQRPEKTDTDAWLHRLDALPGKGDPLKGGRIFHYAGYAACARCHRQDGRGSVVGPDLSRPRKDERWLLESILQPSAEMAPEYRPRAIVLEDGRTFTGIRLRSSTSEVIRDANGQNLSFPRDEIESMHELNKSFMPDGIVDRLTDRELRDLLAFLMQE